MADETAPVKVKPDPAQIRTDAIQAFQDATTKEARAKIVNQFPFLAAIYSADNYS